MGLTHSTVQSAGKDHYIYFLTRSGKSIDSDPIDIRNRFHQRFETELEKLNAGLSKKGTTKRYEKIVERIGRLKQKNTRVAQEYDIDVFPDDEKKNAIKIAWKKCDKANDKDTLSGVYCLRSNVLQWSEETLRNTYVMLTDLEATFRSMKTEFGLRPVFHQKEDRVTSHLLNYIASLSFSTHDPIPTNATGYSSELGEYSENYVSSATHNHCNANRAV